jgi:AcrR family transcriptional regulator
MAMTRIERKEATRVRVVSVAADLFAEHGYEAVTMRTVAKAAGFSTGAVFNSVKDKAELFLVATGLPAPDVRAFLDRVIHSAP